MLKPFDAIVSDIEGNGLYDTVTKLHCAVAICAKTGEERRFGPDQLEDYYSFIQGRYFIGHNVIDYDCPVLEKFSSYVLNLDLVGDTLVMSRLAYPERPGGHSLDSWGQALGVPKMDYRAEAVKLGIIPADAPKGAEFQVYHPKMLDYNCQDCRTNRALLLKLLKFFGWTLEDLIRNSKEINLWQKAV